MLVSLGRSLMSWWHQWDIMADIKQIEIIFMKWFASYLAMMNFWCVFRNVLLMPSNSNSSNRKKDIPPFSFIFSFYLHNQNRQIIYAIEFMITPFTLIPQNSLKFLIFIIFIIISRVYVVYFMENINLNMQNI